MRKEHLYHEAVRCKLNETEGEFDGNEGSEGKEGSACLCVLVWFCRVRRRLGSSAVQ